ncbi:hypothetical protein ASC66_09460 [Leifsonia sp. Root4]|uniref:O-antigen ligase family protein n=1 Tax=Leifsonia sp. Root4 TaxID=1736525 RepID=UPI0006F3BA41|nr:O-antigen ligase family protein [Leifsonia sp. Root4]KQW06671.1 hypothetical protein ASC66_09460 [Leifsonia sp. Root4]
MGVLARPEFVLALLICLAVCLPYIARVLNEDSSIHPVAFAVGAVAVMLGVFRFESVKTELLQRWPLYVGGALVAGVGLATTMSAQGDHGKAYVVNQLVVPVLVFAIVQVMLRGNAVAIRPIAAVVVALGCAQVALGAAQIATQGSIFFASSFAEYAWFDTMIAENRAVGTLDHSLVLALFLFISICFAQYLTSVWFRWAATAVLMGGVLLTQSRMILLIAVLAIVIFLFRDEHLARYRRWAAAVAVVTAVLFAVSPPGQSLIGRFQEDLGSTDRRVDALAHFASVWQEYLFTGAGFGSSTDLTEEAALKSSLENPFLMMTVDIGLAWAVLWFGMQLMLALGFSLKWNRLLPQPRASFPQWVRRRWAVAPAFIAAIGAFAFTQTFSSTANQSAASLLVWFCLAVLAASLEALPGQEQRSSLRPESSRSAGTVQENSIG